MFKPMVKKTITFLGHFFFCLTGPTISSSHLQNLGSALTVNADQLGSIKL